ncbi:ferredoxin [Streptomyces cellulosae]|uniref:Ferredoxin n=1 Tax=Streptomyces cellulosae TaxID=1968 RepID=A0ABW7XYH9_STRCE
MAAPEVFDRRDEDGVVVPPDAKSAAEHHPAVREAAGGCPAAATALDETA